MGLEEHKIPYVFYLGLRFFPFWVSTIQSGCETYSFQGPESALPPPPLGCAGCSPLDTQGFMQPRSVPSLASVTLLTLHSSCSSLPEPLVGWSYHTTAPNAVASASRQVSMKEGSTATGTWREHSVCILLWASMLSDLQWLSRELVVKFLVCSGNVCHILHQHFQTASE